MSHVADDRRALLVRAVSVLSGLAGASFVAWTLAGAADDFDEGLVPSLTAFGAVGGARVVSMVAAAVGFLAVVEPAARSVRVVRAFSVSQLAKYLPGGIWQPASQISIMARGGGSLRRATVDYSWGLVVLLCSSAVLGAGVAAFGGGDVPVLARLGAAVGATGGLVLLPSVPRRMAAGVARLRRRSTSMEPPPPVRVAVSFAAFLASNLIDALSYAFLLRTFVPDAPLAAAATAFAAARLAGVLAVPVPSGIGVREGALLALLGPSVATAPILAASLALRVATMAAELVFAAALVLGRYRLEPARDEEIGRRA